MKSIIIAALISFCTIQMNQYLPNEVNPVEYNFHGQDQKEKDWKTIKKAILEKDVKKLAGFASNDALDAQALINDAAAHSFIHDVLKTYDFEHLKKEEIEGQKFLVFEAHMAQSDGESASARVYKIYLSENDGHLLIDFYVNVSV